jgi:DNA ligase (NAD+)
VYKIKHYIGTSKKGLGILGIGDSVLNALTSSGLVESPADLYRLTVGGIKNLKIGTNSSGGSIRLGSSRAHSITAEIAKAKRVPLAKFLGALGVDLLGRRRVEIIAEQCDIRTLSEWLDGDKLAMIPGDTIRRAVVSGLQLVAPIIDELLEVGVEVIDIGVKELVGSLQKVESDDPIAGKTFCFTGTRAHLEEVEARGGIIKSGISKSLDVLVQKDATSSSNKSRKAESYGVKIIGIATLEAVLKGERELV